MKTMRVIGTAGHIDHGKSALVRRLTGIDPDRLAEEKARGMTIDLGFAWLELPSGIEASIVDVPGHERFIKNMLAGAAGIDVALLVVAADEGVMPQTREHLDILDLLGVTVGVIALTKADLADEELRALVAEDVSELIAKTGLKGSPIIPVSSVTGEGLEQLVPALDRAVSAPGQEGSATTTYLPVDRVFTVAGFGTVVTGTLVGGRIGVGDNVEILPSARRARIRGLQAHKHPLESIGGGNRVAVNLAGVTADEVRRGDVLAPAGLIHPEKRFDAFVRVLGDSTVDLDHAAQVSLHLGAAEHLASVSVLGGDGIAPGESGWIQLRSSQPMVAAPGQRFILRLPSPVGTIAGGEVVDLTPRHRRHDAKAVERLTLLHSGDPPAAVRAALSDGRPQSLEDIARCARLGIEAASDILSELVADGAAINLGDQWVSAERWHGIADRSVRELEAYHSRFPLKNGMPKEELRRRLGIDRTGWSQTIALLARERDVQVGTETLAAASHKGGIQGRESDARRVIDLLQENPFAPPTAKELLQRSSVDAAFLNAMSAEGMIVRIADDLFLARDAYDRLLSRVLDMIAASGTVTVADLRDDVQTSRKYALAFLEHLDGEHITRRSGDARVRGSKQVVCA